jgi:hypothetical protein
VSRQSRRQHGHVSPRRDPPPPTPPHRVAGGGKKNAPEMRRQIEPARRSRSIPPASAKIRPASCRRRSAQSTARSGRRGPLPAIQVDARAATSRGSRTSGGNGPAAARPVRKLQSSGCGAAPPRAKPPVRFRRGAAAGQSVRPSRRTRTANPCCKRLPLPSSRPARAAWWGPRRAKLALEVGGVFRQVQCQIQNGNARRDPQPPTPPLRGGRGECIIPPLPFRKSATPCRQRSRCGASSSASSRRACSCN